MKILTKSADKFYAADCLAGCGPVKYTSQKADQILVMERGKLVEKGQSHGQLLRKNGAYSDIVRQSELKG